MLLTYETVEDAFYFVSSAPLGEHVAVASRSTGKVYYACDLLGHDGMPDDLEQSDDYVDIPHMDFLHPGRPIIQFVRQRCPDKMNQVRAIFERPGAHSRYKTFLAENDLLEEWYVFEMDRTAEALLEWYKERGIYLKAARGLGASHRDVRSKRGRIRN